MKKSLFQGRAFYAALFVLLLSMVGSKNALAQNQVATLQHNDSITGVFYGADAFVSAYNAAVDGDVITLSSGTFNKCNIGKAITVRGAGCTYDSVTQVIPTIILGSFSIGASNINFEGIFFSGTVFPHSVQDVSFTKCFINMVDVSNQAGAINNWQFINCIISNFKPYYASSSTYYAHFVNLNIINSVVRFTYFIHRDVSKPTTIFNSVILFISGHPIQNIVAHNSIFATVSDHSVSNCTFQNCIGIKTGETSLFEGQTTQNVMEVNSCEDIFETFTGEVTFDNIYQLKQNVASSFLGNDGTEVGIYGGVMPYRTRPNYMIIKNCNVAGRTTEDNKLSVEIELFNAGE